MTELMTVQEVVDNLQGTEERPYIDLNKSNISSQVVRGGKTVQASVSEILGEWFLRPLAYLISN